MYSFPIAAQIARFKTALFTILQFWGLEVLSESPWAKIKVLTRLCLFLEALGESVSLPVQLLKATFLGWWPLPMSSQPATLGQVRLILTSLWFSNQFFV